MQNFELSLFCEPQFGQFMFIPLFDKILFSPVGDITIMLPIAPRRPPVARWEWNSSGSDIVQRSEMSM